MQIIELNNMIIHYFDNRIRKQANKCICQSVSKILHTLKQCSDKITDTHNLEEKKDITSTNLK